jgi:hypothetical protein
MGSAGVANERLANALGKRFAEPQAERNNGQNKGDFSERASDHNSLR